MISGAELLVRGASRLALSFGISPLVVGLTIVVFGTSAPEITVSVGAALDGRTDIAIGNVIGSNIMNVLFILGLSALITPLVVKAQIVRQEVPIMIGASLLLRCGDVELRATAHRGDAGRGDAAPGQDHRPGQVHDFKPLTDLIGLDMRAQKRVDAR